MHSPIATVVDWAAVGVVVASIAGWLPPVAALLSIVWLGCQIITWVVNKGWRRK